MERGDTRELLVFAHLRLAKQEVKQEWLLLSGVM